MSLDDIAARTAGYRADDLPVAAARALMLAAVTAVDGIEAVAPSQALDRVLAADLRSPIDLPPQDNAAMDGYAYDSGVTPSADGLILMPVGTSLAGAPYRGAVPRGGCVRIMTGAAMPAGCDTVAPFEQCRNDGERVLIAAPVPPPGANRRRRGEDYAQGEVALAAGTLLRPAQIAVIAALGIAPVPVRRRLRVAVCSTGSELREAGAALDDGAVYDSNRIALAAMLARLGCAVLDLGIVRDEPAAIEAALRDAAERADAVLTSGGVSAGDADFMRPMMARLGEMLFWKLAFRPGRPMAFGRLAAGQRAVPLFALPGNPGAAMAVFHALVRDVLRAMQGANPSSAPQFAAACRAPLRKRPGRLEFARGRLRAEPGGWAVMPCSAQGSASLRGIGEADCFIVLPPDRGDVAAGETVQVLPFEGLA
jgi:molybdopterin molybdotransferase